MVLQRSQIGLSAALRETLWGREGHSGTNEELESGNRSLEEVAAA